MKKLKVVTLNTLECYPSKNDDPKLMGCTVRSRGGNDGYQIHDVFSVEGNLSVIPTSKHGGGTYIKTAPYIGSDATVEIKERGGTPEGKDVVIEQE